MRRDELLSSVSVVLNLLSDSQVFDTLAGPGRTENNVGVFQSFSIISQRVPSLTATEKQVIKILGLAKLLDPAWWAGIQRPENSKDNITGLRRMVSAISRATDFLPEMMRLLERESDGYRTKIEKELADSLGRLEVIDLIFPDSSTDEYVGLDQINAVLKAVADIYGEFSRVFQKESSKLRMLALDSGTSIKISIFGDGDILAAIKQAFVNLWNRLMLYEERKSSLRVENVTKALPAISGIDELLRKGALTQEEADAFKHHVATSLGIIVANGAIIPEVRQFVSQTAQAIGSRPVPLLTHEQAVHPRAKNDEAIKTIGEESGNGNSGHEGFETNRPSFQRSRDDEDESF